MTHPTRVCVMLSGGVDSSVAAARLVDSGYDVEGIYMRNWSFDRLSPKSADFFSRSCSTHQDEAYAQSVAQYLHIPFRSVSFEQKYWDLVIEPFFYGIAQGYMPNPDVWCNQYIKYGVFLDYALAQGADYVASGHYARIDRDDRNQLTENRNEYRKHLLENRNVYGKEKVEIRKSENLVSNFESPNDFPFSNNSFHLLRGIDPTKDQSYFLAHVPKEKLARALFPIGHLYKSQVRAEAFARGLPTATKKDSQGICFIGKIPIKEFLKERFPEKRGDVVLKDGTKVGEHDGAWFYTIGERIGFSLNRNQLTENRNEYGKQLSESRNEYGKEKIENRKSFAYRQADQISNFPARNAKLALAGRQSQDDFPFSNNHFPTPDLPPLYIIKKDIKRNILVVGEDDGSEPLYTKELSADNWNFFEMPIQDVLYDIEIRYHQQPKSAGQISQISNNKSQITNKSQISNSKKLEIGNWKLEIALKEPVRAVTPGQTVILSKGERIIGAGTIR